MVGKLKCIYLCPVNLSNTLKSKIMATFTVSFPYTDNRDCEYLIVAEVTPGKKAPAQNFDRFQEPDDPDEVEPIKVLALDDDGAGHEVSEDIFSDAEIADIKAKACEEYYTTGKDEEDCPDFF